MSQAAGRIRFTAPSPQPWNRPDHDVKPGRLRIALVRALKPRSKRVVRAGRTANLPLFSVATSGTWSLAEVTVATHVLLAALLSRPSPPRQGQAARGRCASPDTTATAEGGQPSRRTGRTRSRSPAWAGPRFAGPLAAINLGDEPSLTVICGHSAPQVRPCDRTGLYRFPS